MIAEQRGFTGFRKGAYKNSDRKGAYYLSVVEANKADIKEVIELFEEFCRAKGVSIEKVIRELREKGIIISRNGLNQGKRGKFETSSVMWLNILCVYMGYNGMNELFRSLPLKD